MLKQGRVIALDSTANLLSRFSGPTLGLRLAPGAVVPAELAARARAGEDGLLRFDLSAWGEVEAILAALRRAGVEILDLEPGKPDLEQVFMRTMQEAK
jgi:ABC-2 type transport system ATP-binding protein